MKQVWFLIFLIYACYTVNGQGFKPKYILTTDTVMLGSVTVSSTVPLNDSQIEKFYRTNSFSTIDNLTSHLEGVSLIKRGAYAMEPQLDGFSGGQLNITIDGMKMFGACTDKMDPVTSYLEPANLKSITLDHGTNGGLNGNNVGGSMDFALKDPENNGMHLLSSSLLAGYESASDGRNILVSTGFMNKRWAWGFNGVYRKNDNYRAGNGKEIEHSQFGKYNFHTVLIYKTDSFSAIRTDLLWDVARNVGYPALPMDVSRARAYLAAAEFKRDRAKYTLKAKLYYNSVFHRMDDSGRDSLFHLKSVEPGGNDSVYMRMDMPGWSQTIGGYIHGQFNIGSRNRLTVKIDNYTNSSLAKMTMHMHYSGNPDQPPMYLETWPDVKRNVCGIYISDEIPVNNKFSVTFSGRLDLCKDWFGSSIAKEQFSVFGYSLARSYFTFTKGVNAVLRYHIFKPVVMQLQSGYSQRLPTVSERYGFYLYNAYDGYDYVGQPDLKTEKSFFARAELIYFRSGFKASLSGSANLLRDYILGVTDLTIPPMNFYAAGLRKYGNIQGVRIICTDLQVLYSLNNGLSFYLLSKYTYGQVGSVSPLPLIPPFKNTFSIVYGKRWWSVQAENESALMQTRVDLLYGETKSPGYTVFNIKTSVHIMLKGQMFDLSAGVTNLFDRNYYDHLDWGRIPRPGRSINLLVKFTR